MRHWLVKFAPFRYSWQDCLANGRFEIYSVRNYQARNNLQEMALGDRVLFYHSQKGRQIMGEMKVIEEAHQDFTTSDERWVSVTFEPITNFDEPVTLTQLKEDGGFEELGLIRQPRLSVMPVEKCLYEKILEMGNAN